MSNWTKIPQRKPGYPENGAFMDPMPKGPYLVCSQFEESAFEGKSVEDILEEHKNMTCETLPKYMYGKVAFAFDENGQAYKCYYHYDTSD